MHCERIWIIISKSRFPHCFWYVSVCCCYSCHHKKNYFTAEKKYPSRQKPHKLYQIVLVSFAVFGQRIVNTLVFKWKKYWSINSCRFGTTGISAAVQFANRSSIGCFSKEAETLVLLIQEYDKLKFVHCYITITPCFFLKVCSKRMKKVCNRLYSGKFLDESWALAVATQPCLRGCTSLYQVGLTVFERCLHWCVFGVCTWRK